MIRVPYKKTRLVRCIKIAFGVSSFSIAFLAGPLCLAQEEFTLGAGAAANSEKALDAATPGDDFPSEESKSLFDDEPKIKTTPDEVITKPGTGGARSEPQPGTGKSRVVPMKSASKPDEKKNAIPQPVKSQAPKPVPSAKPAPAVKPNSAPAASSAALAPKASSATPATPLKSTSLVKPVEVPRTAVLPVPIPVKPVAAIPSKPAVPAPVVQPEPAAIPAAPLVQEVVAPIQNFEAPLNAEGVAPIKRLSPLAANDFSGVPPMPGSRRSLARGQAPEAYVVEAGDTLFDVCSQLIDDGNYWPRLWSMNTDIKNPHFIYPGMKLAFYPGDPLNPPFVEVVEEDEMIPVDKGPIKEEELVTQASHIPQTNSNFTTSDEAIEVIGPDGVSSGDSLSDIFETAGQVYSRDEMNFVLPGFIFDVERDGLGLVDSGYNGEVLAGDGIHVRIVEAQNLSNEGVYSVLRYTGEVVHPVTGDFVGFRYDFSGNIRVKSKRGDGVFDGVVQNSRIGLRPGDIVVPFLSTVRHIDGYHIIGPTSAADASIVGMARDSQTFAGEGGVVFLDRGGLSPGSFYSVYQKNRFSGMPGSHSSSDDSGSRNVGVLRIVESNNKGAVAIIVKNSGEIRLGDRLTARE